MKQISQNKLPAAIDKWTNDFDNFWLHRYIRSLGYTLKEVVKLSETDDEICRALKFARDSIFEKVMYRIANGTFNPEAADFVYKVYLSYLAPVAREIIEIDLNLDKDNQIDFPEDDIDDDSNENEIINEK